LEAAPDLVALDLRDAGLEGTGLAVDERRRVWAKIMLTSGSIALLAGLALLLSSLAPMLFQRPDSATVVAPLAAPATTALGPSVAGPSGLSIPQPNPATIAKRPNLPVDGFSFEIRIPALGYSAMVHQGVSLKNLSSGPGHYPTTAWPGKPGNVGVAAHNVYWLSFNRLKVGDRVEIQTQHGLYVYEVTGSKVTDPNDRTVLAATRDDRLTLTTCYPLWAGAFATQRLIFFAREIGAVG
jgi:LPXTG-site transpeptidase (sortase) family protein